MLKKLLFLVLMAPFTVAAQYHISGRVVDIVSKKPVADVSILLSNASAGTKAGDDGTFTVSNIRGGQYELVVSIIGYETYRVTVMVNKDINLGDVGILQKSVMLNEVRIGPDKHWAEHYEHFKRVFLGLTDNASKCEIINPHVLSFFSEDGKFTANADGFLEIENKALGYKIKYQLVTFTDEAGGGKMYYAGTAFFENMQGSKHQLKTWAKNRMLTYYGSDMQFLRSVIADQVKENGFLPRRLVQSPNPAYKKGSNSEFIWGLVNISLQTNEYSTTTNIPGVYALKFKDILDVTYNNNPLSESRLSIDAEYALFDNNGILLDPEKVIKQGNWGDSRVADMLPVDYEPDKK